VVVHARRDISEPAWFGGRWEHSGEIPVLRADLEPGAHQQEATDTRWQAAGQAGSEVSIHPALAEPVPGD